MKTLYSTLLIISLGLFTAISVSAETPSGEIIGKWLDESSYAGGKYTLMKRNEKTIMVVRYKDGSHSEKEMIQKNQSGRLRLEKREGDEYYLIEKNGSLGSYDDYGLIRTMRIIK